MAKTLTTGEQVNTHTDEEMKEKWDPWGCYQRSGGGKQFTACTKCGHGYIDWFKKYEIDKKNKVLKQTFDRNLAKYNKKKKTARKGGRGSRSLQLSRCLSSSAATATSTSILGIQALAQITVWMVLVSYATALAPLW